MSEMQKRTSNKKVLLIVGGSVLAYALLGLATNAVDLNAFTGADQGTRDFLLQEEAYVIGDMYREKLEAAESTDASARDAHAAALDGTVSQLFTGDKAAPRSGVYQGQATTSDGILTVRDGLKIGLDAGSTGFNRDSSFRFALENLGACAVFEMSRTIGPTRVVRLDGERLGEGATCTN